VYTSSLLVKNHRSIQEGGGAGSAPLVEFNAVIVGMVLGTKKMCSNVAFVLGDIL
jgi:hypothetical protein